MIIVRFRGGLGNQMFQYAFLLNLMKRYPHAEIVADISHYEVNSEHNGFELGKVFGIDLKVCDRKTLKQCSPYYIAPRGFEKYPSVVKSFIRNRWQYRYASQKKNTDCSYKQESHCSYEAQVYAFIQERISSGEAVYLDGLWQDVRYFENVKDEVFKAFSISYSTPEDINLFKEIESHQKPTLGVHVRRGDFTNSKFDICPLSYYKDALNLLDNEDTFAYIFTDEPEYVEENFSFISSKKIISHDIDHSYIDMALLGACETLVLSNSTFAFWAAYLSTHAKKVIAPKYSVIKKETKYQLNAPTSWIIVDNSK